MEILAGLEGFQDEINIKFRQLKGESDANLLQMLCLELQRENLRSLLSFQMEKRFSAWKCSDRKVGQELISCLGAIQLFTNEEIILRVLTRFLFMLSFYVKYCSEGSQWIKKQFTWLLCFAC